MKTKVRITDEEIRDPNGCKIKGAVGYIGAWIVLLSTPRAVVIVGKYVYYLLPTSFEVINDESYMKSLYE